MYIMIQYFCPPGILRKIDENVALFRTLIQTNITGKIIKEELEKKHTLLAYSYSSFNI